MDVAIRTLTPADAAAWHVLRLDGLARHPEAFGGSVEEETSLDAAALAARLSPPAPSAVFGAFAPGLVGAVGLDAFRPAKLRHRALVWGVYVAPAARGLGVGAALLAAVAAHARAAGLERLELGVGVGNAPARALYIAAGYVPYGVERRALRLGPGRYVDEELRALDLAAPA